MIIYKTYLKNKKLTQKHHKLMKINKVKIYNRKHNLDIVIWLNIHKVIINVKLI